MDKRNIFITMLFGLGLIGLEEVTRRKFKQIDDRLITTESLAEHANESAAEAKAKAKLAYDCQLKHEERHLQDIHLQVQEKVKEFERIQDENNQ